jgi:hypothetical protein
MMHGQTNIKKYISKCLFDVVRFGQFVTAKLRSSALGLQRIVHRKSVVVKLWGIITFALSAQNKFYISGQ